jgi:hypothetical protein
MCVINPCKDTKKRAKYQIYLDIFECEYSRRQSMVVNKVIRDEKKKNS